MSPGRLVFTLLTSFNSRVYNCMLHSYALLISSVSSRFTSVVNDSWPMMDAKSQECIWKLRFVWEYTFHEIQCNQFVSTMMAMNFWQKGCCTWNTVTLSLVILVLVVLEEHKLVTEYWSVYSKYKNGWRLIEQHSATYITIKRWSYEVNLDWQFFSWASQACSKSSFHSINALITIACYFNVCSYFYSLWSQLSFNVVQ